MSLAVLHPSQAPIAESGKSERSGERWHYIVLLFVLLVAAMFRLQDFQQPLVDAFSWREASTAMMADNFYSRSWNILYPEVSWTGPGASYQGRELQTVSYITALLYAAFGWHDWFGRIVAVGFAVLGVFSFHRLLNRTWGIAHAHAGALMLALMPGTAFIDRSFLPDPAMLAMVTTGCWLYVEYLQNDRWPYLITAFLVTTIGIMAKLPGIIVLAPMAYATLDILHRRGALTPKRILPLFFVASAVVIAVAGYYRWVIYLGATYPPYHTAGNGYLWEDGLGELVRNRFYIDRTWDIATSWFLTFPIFLLTGLALLVGPPRAAAGRRFAPWLFHIWLGACAMLYFVGAREITSNPWNLHIFSVPIAAFAGRGVLLIASMGSTSVADWRYWCRVGIVGGVVALTGYAAVESNLKPAYAWDGYKLGRRLHSLSHEGDLVIAIAPTVGDPVAIYYSRRRGWVFPPGGGKKDWSVFMEDTQQAINELESLRGQGAKWFGVTKNAHDSKGRYFLNHHQNLISYLEKSAEKVVDDDDLLIYRLELLSQPKAEDGAG